MSGSRIKKLKLLHKHLHDQGVPLPMLDIKRAWAMASQRDKELIWPWMHQVKIVGGTLSVAFYGGVKADQPTMDALKRFFGGMLERYAKRAQEQRRAAQEAYVKQLMSESAHMTQPEQIAFLRSKGVEVRTGNGPDGETA